MIFSIHQPRYSIFRQFDHMTLMNKGEIIFAGAPDKALGYFEKAGEMCVKWGKQGICTFAEKKELDSRGECRFASWLCRVHLGWGYDEGILSTLLEAPGELKQTPVFLLRGLVLIGINCLSS